MRSHGDTKERVVLTSIVTSLCLQVSGAGRKIILFSLGTAMYKLEKHRGLSYIPLLLPATAELMG